MFPKDDEEDDMGGGDDGSGGGDDDVDQQILQELQDYARHGYGGELAQRYGKSLPMEGSDEEEAGESPDEEDAEIPGVESDGSDMGDASGGGIDQDKLKALLASLKSGG